MFSHKDVYMDYGAAPSPWARGYFRHVVYILLQHVFIYIGSISIKIVSRCFTETHSRTNEQATAEIEHSHLTGRNLEQAHTACAE